MTWTYTYRVPDDSAALSEGRDVCPLLMLMIKRRHRVSFDASDGLFRTRVMDCNSEFLALVRQKPLVMADLDHRFTKLYVIFDTAEEAKLFKVQWSGEMYHAPDLSSENMVTQ